MDDHLGLLKRAKELLPEMVSYRRQFHQHPELGMEEHKTAATVAGALCGLGIEVREGVGGTGVVGLIRGRGEGRTIAIRADMDALPITEERDSRTPPRSPAGCTPAATMATRRACSAWPGC